MKGLLATAKGIFMGKYEDKGAMKLLNEWKPAGHGPLVQIGNAPTPVVVTTSVNSTVNSNLTAAGD